MIVGSDTRMDCPLLMPLNRPALSRDIAGNLPQMPHLLRPRDGAVTGVQPAEVSYNVLACFPLYIEIPVKGLPYLFGK